jgi:serine/threonine protein kinase
MHSRKPDPIVHRDISLDNILIETIENNEIKRVVLSDFDAVREIGDKYSNFTIMAGKIRYYAPEVPT